MKLNKRAFTLVELIIVIAIIAVLAVISVLTVSEWIGKSRDTRRLGDLTQIEKSLEVGYVKNGSYPTPDNSVNVSASGVVIGYQGKFCDGAVSKTPLKATPKDPLDDVCYTYYVDTGIANYQVMAMLESNKKMTAYNGSEALAADYSKRYPSVRGAKLGILVVSGTNQPIEESGTGVDVINTTNTYIAYIDSSTTISGTGQSLSPLTIGKNVLPSGTLVMVIGGQGGVSTGDNNKNGIYAGLYFPSGISVDYLGNIIVSDLNNAKIRKYDKYGNWLLTIGSISGDNTLNGSNAQFVKPREVQVDVQGNIYAVDYTAKKIKKYDPNGNYLMTLGGGTGDSSSGTGASFTSQGITIDKIGNIYVADQAGTKLKKYDSNGNWLMTIGSTAGDSNSGGTQAQFTSINGVAIDSIGNIYVPDSSTYKIKKYDSNGNWLMNIGSGSSGLDNNLNGTNAVLSPFRIYIDSNNNLYVIDTVNRKLKKYDSNGNWLMNIGGGSLTTNTAGDNNLSGPLALLNIPWGVAVDKQGYIYIADSNNHKIKVYSP